MTTRFKGGEKALADGMVDIASRDPRRRRSEGAPSFAFDAARLEARFDETTRPRRSSPSIERFSPADRQKATDHLLHVSLVARDG